MRNDTTNTCPVCGFSELDEPAYDAHGCASFQICPCCGVEFGYDDATRSHKELRAQWIQRGMPWWSTVMKPPIHWNPVAQLQTLESREKHFS